MHPLKDIKRDFLQEGLHDAVGLWRFGGRVRTLLGTEDDEEVKDTSECCAPESDAQDAGYRRSQR